MGQIADILYARGEMEEALRIWQEEQLPVYEWLGDVRSQGITLYQIGDIYSDLGQVEQARQFYTQAEEIFEEIKSPYVELAREGLAELEEREKH